MVDPVHRFTLPEGKEKKRLALVVALVAVALLAFGIGIYQSLSKGKGWTTIEARTGSPGCAGEFRFDYCLDAKRPTNQYRALVVRYTEATEWLAKVYDADTLFEGVGNLAELNAHPNETVSLEPELYAALEQIASFRDRVLYLAPIYETYRSLFFCEEDEETSAYDPLTNESVAEEFAQIAAFASDPEQVDVMLLGDGKAILKVSAEYDAFCKEHACSKYLDLGWMRNAFILDDLARTFREAELTHGFLQSVDGFGVNLDSTGQEYSMNVFDKNRGGVGLVAVMEYTGPLQYLSLHSYSLNPSDRDWYYECSDGSVRSIFLDPADGMPKTALDDLLLYSGEAGVGEMLLTANRTFLKDTFDPAQLWGRGFFYLYADAGSLHSNDPSIRLSMLDPSYTVSTTVE